MSDRELGLRALRIWYVASGFQYSGVTFDQAVAHFDSASPTFIAGFGSSTKYATADRVEEAMQELGAQGMQRYPFHGSFFDALSAQVLTFKFQDAVDVVQETAKDVRNVAAVGAGIYIAILAIGVVLVIWSEKNTAKAGIKKAYGDLKSGAKTVYRDAKHRVRG